MTRSRAFVALGVLALLLGVLMPESWYDPLPQREAVPPAPISGILLLKASLVLEAGALLWMGLRRREPSPAASAADRLSVPGAPAEPEDPRRAAPWLLLITALGLLLRLIALGSGLWLDELTPILDYRDATIWQVVISYIASNNHILYTLLSKLSISLFGEHEWAIRLPAALFGTATIPVVYGLSRQAMARRASLSAALLLAVSYHHVFFSQNARGYSAYLLFSLLSSLLLVKGLKEDRTRDWALYVVATVLNFASILISAFVFAAHVLTGALVLLSIRRKGGSAEPMLRRLLGVFAVAGFLGFQLYSVALPQAYVYMRTVYSDPSAGFALFSRALVAEVARGLGAGFATGLVFGAIPFLLLAAAGVVSLARRNWVVMVALAAPGVLQASLVVAGRLSLSPRFFILALPLAVLVAARGIDLVADLGARLLKRGPAFPPRFSLLAVSLLGIASMASLPRYYTVPKQAYRSALTYVEATRGPDDIVIVIHLAEFGTRYYGGPLGIREGKDYFFVRTVEKLDRVLSENPGRRSWLVVTFPRALRLGLPDLEARVRTGWTPIRAFPATVGDGDITIWLERGAQFR